LFLTMDSITQHGSTARASFTASVDLAGGHVWAYRGQFGLSHSASGWKVQWSPAVVYPDLGPGQRLAVVTQFPDRAPVLDVEGQPLQVLGSVYVLGVWPGRLSDPAATATAFAKLTHLDAGQVLGQIKAAPPQQFLQLASLDPTTYAGLRSALHGVPGLVVQQQRKRLFQAEATGLIGGVGNEINPVLRNEGAYYVPGTTVGLSGLEQTYQRQLLGTPTTEVVAVTAGGTQAGVLARWPGAAGTPVRTTISSATQDAALSALNSVPGSGDIVAVRASTGEVLAIAQRHGSGSAAVDALSAKLTPGSAFTIVSAAALLGSGLTSSSQLTCGKSLTLDGQTFTGAGPGSSVPFSKAFADGCSTALASASQRLTAGELDQAARDLGIGANWSGLPVPAFSGSVPANASGGQLAAETLGQGNVQMSPLAMAMVAAAVDSGRWHTPRFLAGSADPAGTALSPGNMSQLRGLMRTAVTTGSAQAANASGDPVYGQVGLVHAGSTWTSWFTGFRGDIAFTVVESGPTAKLSAAALASTFLSALGS
jgi:cell division protein FtsI/penicillin-binding protein 2